MQTFFVFILIRLLYLWFDTPVLSAYTGLHFGLGDPITYKNICKGPTYLCKENLECES